MTDYPYGRPAGRIVDTVGIHDPGIGALIACSALGEPNEHGPHHLHPTALTSYLAMRSAAIGAGLGPHCLAIASSYRSSEVQARLFAAAIERYGSEDRARRWVAPPGRSAHCTGCAVDFALGPPNSSDAAKAGMFDHLPAWLWLRENAGHYGWNRYVPEPWHWEFNVAQLT